MIRLKPLLEVQLIREALPYNLAKKYVSMERNPAIEEKMDDIISKLAETPGAKVSKRRDRVAVPFRVEAPIIQSRDYDDVSPAFNSFLNKLYREKEEVNSLIQRSDLPEDRKKLFPQLYNDIELVYKGQVFDQYNRPVKITKYIKTLYNYKKKLTIDHYRGILQSRLKSDPKTGEIVIMPYAENADKVEPIKWSKFIDQLIGHMPDEFANLMQQFDNIPEIQEYRQNKDKQYYIVFSKHHYDVAGMSTNRGWTSCMNLYGGSNSHYVQYDVKEGTIVAYLVDETDLNINKPIARLLIKPFVNSDNEDIVLYQSEESVYGTAPKSFKSVVDDLVNQAQPGKYGYFELIDTLYCDSSDRIVKFNPETLAKIDELVNSRQQATTVDEARYMLRQYFNIPLQDSAKFKYTESDKLYVSPEKVPGMGIIRLKNIPYCPVQFSTVNIWDAWEVDDLSGFPVNASSINLHKCKINNFSKLNTDIQLRLYLSECNVTSFDGLKTGVRILEIDTPYGGNPSYIETFRGLPSSIESLHIRGSVLLEMTFDEFISQLKQTNIRYLAIPDLTFTSIHNIKGRCKLLQTMYDKMQSIPAYVGTEKRADGVDANGKVKWKEIQKEYPSSKFTRLMGLLASEVPTLEHVMQFSRPDSATMSQQVSMIPKWAHPINWK